MESVLVNVGVGVLAAAFGVYAGVRVHGAQIDEITRRLDRIENKLDRVIERERDR